MAAGKIYVGIGGWTFEPWRETFYDKGLAHKRELEFASRRLTSIEVNGTYYRSQTPDTFAKWHDETPDGFVFALKAPRYATNRRVLAEAGPSIEKFVDSGLARLAGKLGPINWQFMATKTFQPDDFGAFLALLPKDAGGLPLRHAVEVRHPSFACREFVEMIAAHGVAAIMAGDSDYPQIADRTAAFSYLRILGTTDAHPAGYPPAELDRWAGHIAALAAGTTPPDLETVGGGVADAAGDVFAYVIGGAKQRNPHAAMGLIERLGHA